MMTQLGRDAVRERDRESGTFPHRWCYVGEGVYQDSAHEPGVRDEGEAALARAGYFDEERRSVSKCTSVLCQ
jgi:hypothetical protein